MVKGSFFFFFFLLNGNQGFYVKTLQIEILTSRGTAVPFLKEKKCSFKGERERSIYFWCCYFPTWELGNPLFTTVVLLWYRTHLKLNCSKISGQEIMFSGKNCPTNIIFRKHNSIHTLAFIIWNKIVLSGVMHLEGII